MKRRTSLLAGSLGLLFGALAAGPAPAFVLSRAQAPDGNWYFSRWPDSTHQVRYVMNDLPLQMLPNLAGSSETLAAVQAAMQTWAIAPVQFSVNGTSSVTDSVLDGINLITFADTPANQYYMSSSSLSATSAWAINYQDGYTDHSQTTGYVRCVR